MIRQDLLTLTEEDLTALTNRGIMKRAKREVANEKITATIDLDSDGTITAVWSDNNSCIIHVNKPVQEATCSCPAPPICRHLIRTVLFYQQWAISHPEQPIPDIVDIAEWNPAQFDPALLTLHYGRKLTRQKKLFDSGLLIYLNRLPKPKAYIQTLGCTVQFLVPNDLHYAHCNCNELNKPCSHIPLAIWAFQQIEEEQAAAVIETNQEPAPIDHQLLNQIETSLIEWSELGIATPNTHLRQQWEKLQKELVNGDLIWPASIMTELIQLIDQYARRDALFDPEQLLNLWGELLIRIESIRAGSPNIPALFVRGSEQDKELNFAKIHLTGVGTELIHQKNSHSLNSYFQDNRTGNLLCISHQFPESKSEIERPFWQLAEQKLWKQRSFAQLSKAQLLGLNVKKEMNGRLNLKRAKLSLTKQKNGWETILRPPLFVENFAELQARRQQQYPSSLSPRQLGQNLVVIPITKVINPSFHPAYQMVTALLHDQNEEQIILKYPYQQKATEGTEGLLWWLTNAPSQIKYICGSINNSAQGVEIRPISLFIETNNQFTLFQPDIDRWQKEEKTKIHPRPLAHPPLNPIHSWLSQLNGILIQLLTSGIKNPPPTLIRQLDQLIQLGQTIGFMRLLTDLETLQATLANSQHQLDWQWKDAIPPLFNLLRMVRFAHDIT